MWAAKLKALLHTPSKRTGHRRLAQLQAEGHGGPVQAIIGWRCAKLPTRLPAVGSTWRPTTANAAERLLGAFERFYRGKGPCQNVASAHMHVAGWQVGAVLLLHLLHRPAPSRLRQAIAARYALAA